MISVLSPSLSGLLRTASFTSSSKLGHPHPDENLDEESQAFIKNLAVSVTDDVKNGLMQDAQDKLKTLLSDEKIALWSILDSKTRSAIKSHAETLKKE